MANVRERFSGVLSGGREWLVDSSMYLGDWYRGELPETDYKLLAEVHDRLKGPLRVGTVFLLFFGGFSEGFAGMGVITANLVMEGLNEEFRRKALLRGFRKNIGLKGGSLTGDWEEQGDGELVDWEFLEDMDVGKAISD